MQITINNPDLSKQLNDKIKNETHRQLREQTKKINEKKYYGGE